MKSEVYGEKWRQLATNMLGYDPLTHALSFDRGQNIRKIFRKKIRTPGGTLLEHLQNMQGGPEKWRTDESSTYRV